MPHVEDEDYRIIMQVLTQRLRLALDGALAEIQGESQAAAQAVAALTEQDRVRLARDAAHWVIRDSTQELHEAIFQAIAEQAQLVDAQPLPDVMIFPQDLPLEASAKNIYGVLPPSKEDAQEVENVLFMDERHWWQDQVFPLSDGAVFSVGRYDGAVKLNKLERDFARALDAADLYAGGIATRIKSRMPCVWCVPSMSIISIHILWCALSTPLAVRLCNACWRRKKTPRMQPARCSTFRPFMARCCFSRRMATGCAG